MLRVLANSVLILLILAFATLSFAQERVRVGWAAMTASHTPLWVAHDKRLFAKQGLVVEPIFFGAGPPAMQALVAGDLDIVVTSAPNVVNPRLGGADAAAAFVRIAEELDGSQELPVDRLQALRAETMEHRGSDEIGRRWLSLEDQIGRRIYMGA